MAHSTFRPTGTFATQGNTVSGSCSGIELGGEGGRDARNSATHFECVGGRGQSGEGERDGKMGLNTHVAKLPTEFIGSRAK